MKIPEHYSHYPCHDYFSSSLASEGLWDEQAQCWTIEPSERVLENASAEFLQVGRPGVDGIGFGYRKEIPGFWAFFPMECEFQLLAPTIMRFVDQWNAGEIKL